MPNLGEESYSTVLTKTAQTRLKEIYDYIKYVKLEPLSADRLREELILYGEQLAEAPGVYPIAKSLS
ncbi:MAG TPA: hypothetical protein DCE41_20075 [Cytophagales bacterium]|nr:hypothetical protein [Cytophagales bacterium]HAA20296.1 hypothetical protein [Cytophagales bacterium]HAP63804.1 hypothetical protein [Cytophagales bacterium]